MNNKEKHETQIADLLREMAEKAWMDAMQEAEAHCRACRHRSTYTCDQCGCWTI